MAECAQLDQIKVDVPENVVGCAECLATGGTWVELRACRVCDHVGCCNSSPSTHATKHYQETGHPVMSSAMPGATWSSCYVDEVSL